MAKLTRPPEFHESHTLDLVYVDEASPHSPVWVCSRCQESECALCARPYDLFENADSVLAHTCRGFPNWEGCTVKVGEDETIQARRSGVGWFLCPSNSSHGPTTSWNPPSLSLHLHVK